MRSVAAANKEKRIIWGSGFLTPSVSFLKRGGGRCRV